MKRTILTLITLSTVLPAKGWCLRPTLPIRAHPLPASEQQLALAPAALAPEVGERHMRVTAGTMVTWTELAPTGPLPSARQFHTAIYDPVRDRMVVFGGREYSGFYVNDAWALSLGNPPAWTVLTPSGTLPGGRMLHSAIYDAVRDRMVVFGGWDGDLHHFGNDVWALSLGGTPAWTQLMPAGVLPTGRDGHSAIYDPVRDHMVVFGGWNVSSDHYFNDVWALSLADTPTWTQLTPAGPLPIPQTLPKAFYDPVRDRMVVFGGMDSLWVSFNDVWALSLGDTPAWTTVIPTDTLPIYGSAVYDPVRDRMLVIRSGDPVSSSNTWALSLSGTPVWGALQASGPPPDGRGGWSTIYDPQRDRVVTFGGYGGYYRNDVWALWLEGVLDVRDSRTQPSLGALSPPRPNPSCETAKLSYSIAQAGRVQLGVYDLSGRLVCSLMDGERRAGTETVVWNGLSESGSRLESGVYLVRLWGPGIRETRKLILLR